MDSLTSVLARSKTIKHTYECARRKVSETYRKYRVGRSRERYRELSKQTSDIHNYDFRDPGIPGDDLELIPHPDAENPVLTKDDITDCWARFVADPFVVYAHGLYNLFFEIKSMGGHVFIGHAFSEDGISYEYNQIVMQPEVAEHTYPHIFKQDENWTLVPSPGSNVRGEFRIYESVEFPTDWELRATPLTSDVRLDPTPLYRDGTWYLIYQQVGSYNVVLKYADSLTGDWYKHPSSPLFEPDQQAIEACQIGGAEMVPSGRPLYIDDEIHLCYRSHIDRTVTRYRITELTEKTISQEPCGNLFERQKNEPWNNRFMHTVNPVYPWEKTDNIVAVDGLESDRYRWSIGIYTVDN